MGINLSLNDLSGWNFAGQNLTNARLDAFSLTDTDLTGADLRGAAIGGIEEAIVTNLIGPDGVVAGLNLAGGQMLLIRDNDGNSIGPVPVTIQQHFTMDADGILQLRFETDPWGSMISFEPGIPVSLGGTLKLDFAIDVEIASQVGRTLGLFDWTGVVPTGVFDVESPYIWDLSKLYSTGEVTLLSVPEPSTMLLVYLGGIVYCTVRRRC